MRVNVRYINSSRGTPSTTTTATTKIQIQTDDSALLSVSEFDTMIGIDWTAAM